MHHFLIDERAATSQLQGQLGKIQSWVKTSRVAGEQHSLKSPQQIIEQIQKIIANASTKPTIVVIGDDFSLDIAISSLKDEQRSITLGFIPLTTNSPSAALLGFKDWKQACNALIKAKRAKFHLIAVEDYAILSECILVPKSELSPSNVTETKLTLDGELKVQLPESELTITNLSHESHLQTKKTPFMLESTIISAAHLHLQDKKPLFNVPGIKQATPRQPILKLKGTTAAIETTTPLLLQGIVQLRTDFTVRPLPVQQQLIADSKSDPLA
jgi:hypothetical protein